MQSVEFQSAASGEAAVVVLGVYSGGALRLSASVELTAPAGGAIAEFVAAVSAVDGELLWGRALEPNATGDAPAIVAAPHIIAGARADVVVCATSAGAIPVALVARGVDVVSTAADTSSGRPTRVGEGNLGTGYQCKTTVDRVRRAASGQVSGTAMRYGVHHALSNPHIPARHVGAAVHPSTASHVAPHLHWLRCAGGQQRVQPIGRRRSRHQHMSARA